MIPLTGGVLAAGALVSAPALWRGLVAGTMPVDVAMTRYLIAVAGCWLVLSVVIELTFPSPRQARVRVDEVDETQVEDPTV